MWLKIKEIDSGSEKQGTSMIRSSFALELVIECAIGVPSEEILKVGERSSKKARGPISRAHEIEKSQVRGDVKLSAKSEGN